MTGGLGEALARLEATVEARRDDDPSTSYTARLLAAGRARCAKKFGEEAVEAAIAGALGDREELAKEAADVLYHLVVLLTAAGVPTAAVAAVLASREGVSGVAEKAARQE